MFETITFAWSIMLPAALTVVAILLAVLPFTSIGSWLQIHILSLLVSGRNAIRQGQDTIKSAFQLNRNEGLKPLTPIKTHPTNAQDSSLFFTKLPAEIRHQIFVLIFGGNRFHIEYSFFFESKTLHLQAATCRGTTALPCPAVSPLGYRNYQQTSSQCSASPSIQQQQQLLQSWVLEQTAISSGERSSRDLRDHRFCTLTWVAKRPNTPALLRTCRKVYFEANSILYGRNIFAFDNAAHIEKFSSRLDSATLNNIKHLEVYVVSSWRFHNIDGFAACTERLQGLKTIVVVWRHDIWEDAAPSSLEYWGILEGRIRELFQKTVSRGAELKFERFEGRKDNISGS